MTTENPPYSAGVVIYHDGPYVKLKIVALDSNGDVTHILQGIALPPETARSCAEKLTLASWKAEDGNASL
jgi:hypothetical protein